MCFCSIKCLFALDNQSVFFVANKVTNNATDLEVRPIREPITVTLIGPESDLAELTASSITFTADLTGRDVEEGTTRLALTPSVSSETCWCYGSYTCRATIRS